MPIPAAVALVLPLASSPLANPPWARAMQEPQPGWDEETEETKPEPDAAGDPLGGPEPDESWGDEDEASAPSETGDPTAVPAPAAATPPAGTPPPAGPPTRPPFRKGTGLIVGASVTGGLAWVVALSRMAFIQQCQDQIQAADDVESGTTAATTCFFRAGIGNALLAPVQWVLNYATWGLAPAAGAIRGRHDGVAYAYDKSPKRNAVGFIAGGATLLGVGVIGRVAMYPLFFRAARSCVDAPDKCSRNLQLQLFGVQFSAAAIGGGAGLLAYGISYSKHAKQYGKLLEQHALRITPQIGWDYTGVGVSGRF